eukprot:Gb_00196 [translate_table: standard]
MASSVNRWIRPEAFPIFAATGVAVGMCCFALARNMFTNPEVRVLKENRAAGVLENFEEGERYAEHALRRFVRNRAPEIMPSINKYFTESKS